MFAVQSIEVSGLGRQPFGLNTLKLQTALSPGEARQAQNVVLNPTGAITRRKGFRPTYDTVYSGRVTGLFVPVDNLDGVTLTVVAGAVANEEAAP